MSIFNPDAQLGFPCAGKRGEAFAGEWHALWQYLGCLLQCGDLYEATEAFDDAQHAFKEGLRLVSRCK